MKDIGIERVMSTNPTTIGVDDDISQARALLESGELHHLPVVIHDKLVGIVSSADLLKCYAMSGDLTKSATATVKDIMEIKPTVLERRSMLSDAAKKLARGGFHALPVVDADQTLVGIVTSSDLVTHLLHQLPTDDGSLHEATHTDIGTRISDEEIAEVVAHAEKALENGEHNRVAEVLLYFRQRNRALRRACQAADLYIRSGHAEREHSVLIKRLEEARKVFEKHLL